MMLIQATAVQNLTMSMHLRSVMVGSQMDAAGIHCKKSVIMMAIQLAVTNASVK